MIIIKKIIIGLFLGVVSFIFFLLIAWLIIITAGIRFDLNLVRKPVEISLESALGREVHFNGDLMLAPTLWPTLEIQQVKIDNPAGWRNRVFADVGLIRLQLALLPLFKSKIHLGEVTAKDITINLQNNLQGKPNWHFESVDKIPEQDQVVTTEYGKVPITLEAISTLNLENATLNYHDQKLKRPLRFRLKNMQGRALPDESFELDIEGYLQNKPYSLRLTGGSISDLQNKATDWPVQIKGKVAGTSIRAEGSMLRKKSGPEVHVDFTVGHVDIGATLNWLELASDVVAETDSLSLKTQLRGQSLSELLASSGFKLTINQAVWTLVDPNTKAQLPIQVKQGNLVINPGRPARLTLDSQVDQEPVQINITSARLIDFSTPNKNIPLTINALGVGVELTLESMFSLPIGIEDLGFTMSLQGERLNSFNQLLDIDLPPLGPYQLDGGFAVTPTGYSLKNLQLQLGTSQLQGDLLLATTVTPVKLDMRLISHRVQIDDFDIQGWSATEIAEPQPSETKSGIEQIDQRRIQGQYRRLLTPEVFQSLEVIVDIRVRQVLSGKDILGNGRVKLALEQGRLSIKPFQVDIPGGKAEAEIELYPTKQHIEALVKANVEQFDYGILARRIDEQSKTAGKISLDVDLSAKVKEKQYLLAHGTGHFDFGVWPGNMDADVFDLWAVNLLNAVVSQTDKESNSRVNCAIAGFSLQDGLMKEKVLFVDTSRMQIQATAEVNFMTRMIELYAEPKAKRPEFFSLATPVKVSGSFNDFGIGINPARLTGSVIMFVTSPVHVPLHRLFGISTPADGVEACAKAWKMRNTKP